MKRVIELRKYLDSENKNPIHLLFCLESSGSFLKKSKFRKACITLEEIENTLELDLISKPEGHCKNLKKP